MELLSTIETKGDETDMKITTIGLDLAKSVFHVVCFDERHKEVNKRMLRRSQVREQGSPDEMKWNPGGTER